MTRLILYDVTVLIASMAENVSAVAKLFKITPATFTIPLYTILRSQ